ncbi:MAG: hypothetical protein ACFFD1_15585, partial [Candidatus Thorarchaeota archaeon]
MQNFDDLIKLIVDNIAIIGTILTSLLALIFSIYNTLNQRREKQYREEIRAEDKPVFDIEITTNLEKQSTYRTLIIDVSIENVGKVIATPVSFELSVINHNPPTLTDKKWPGSYPESDLYFNGKKSL